MHTLFGVCLFWCVGPFSKWSKLFHHWGWLSTDVNKKTVFFFLTSLPVFDCFCMYVYSVFIYVYSFFLSYYITLTKPWLSSSLNSNTLKELLSLLITMINTMACPSRANSDIWQKYISIVNDFPFMFYNNNPTSSHACIPTLLKCCRPSSSPQPLTSDNIHIVSTKCPAPQTISSCSHMAAAGTMMRSQLP